LHEFSITFIYILIIIKAIIDIYICLTIIFKVLEIITNTINELNS